MRLRNRINCLSDDKSGNVSVIFAVASMALLMVAGAALDLSDLSSRNTSLQNATDAAVLAAAASGEERKRQLEIVAKSAFDENLTLKDGESISSFDLNLSDTNELTLTTRIEKPTLLMGIVGMRTMMVEVEAATLLSGGSALDIALVLDRTGSMAGQNMTGLINASQVFLNDLSADGRDVRIAVVPFSDYVNVGVNGLPSSMLDFPGTGLAGADVSCEMEDTSVSSCTSGTSGTSGTSSTTATATASTTGGTSTATATSSGGCTTTGTASCTITSSSSSTTTTWADVFNSASGAFCTTSLDPQESSGTLIEECTPVNLNENWFGCVGSRVAPQNAVADFGGNKFPPVYNRTCGEPLVPLTDNLVNARMTIDSMTASGSTYIPAGLQWGWRALEPSAPFESQGTADRQKLLILMTDGENTRSQNGTMHTGNDTAEANRLTSELCSAIKRSDIKIATISYSNGRSGSGDADMLRSCASGDSLYYNANNAQALRRAFEDAANQANNIRLIR